MAGRHRHHETNDQGTILGGPHPQVAARHHQNTLQTRIKVLVARERAGTGGTLWRPVIENIANLGPRVLADPYRAVLDRRLDFTSAAGFDVPALLAEAAGQGPVLDEHPASALWYRLAPTLAPAAMQPRPAARARPGCARPGATCSPSASPRMWLWR